MSGLVVTHIGGGDLCFEAVDDELWDQITEYREAMPDDPGCDRPSGAPDRRGRVLGRLFTQDGVVEPAKAGFVLNGICGILVLP
jgi:hypothetical protein